MTVMKGIRGFVKNLKRVNIYRGSNISQYQKIQEVLEQQGIRYWNYVIDTASQSNIPKIMYFFTPVLFLAPRAFKGSRGIPADQLKTYLIYVKQQDEEKVKGCRKNEDEQDK